MFALMFNTGARVQEVIDLRARDVWLEPPCQARFLGKVRICPIWPRTAQLLKDLISGCLSGPGDPADQQIFVNERGSPITRFGVRYLLQKHVAAAASAAPSPAAKRIHPHSLRHTTAIHLLKAGVVGDNYLGCAGRPARSKRCKSATMKV